MSETIRQRLSVEEAAKELGCAPVAIRFRMRSKKWDLGEVIPPAPGRKRWQYHVYRAKLDRHLGKMLVAG